MGYAATANLVSEKMLIKFVIGDDVSLSIVWTTGINASSQSPVNLTGYTFKMEVRTPGGVLVDTLTTANGRITVPTPANGTFIMGFPRAVTVLMTLPTYNFDISVTYPSTAIRTKFRGDIKPIPQITT